jgi:uncharacterized protein
MATATLIMVDRPIQIALFLLLFFQFLLAWAAYHRIRRMPGRRGRRTALACLAILTAIVVCGFSLNAGRVRTAFPQYYFGERLRAGVTLWMAGTLAGAVLYAGSKWLADRMSQGDVRHNRFRRRFLRTAPMVTAAAPAVVIGYAVFIERLRIKPVEVELSLPGLPEDLHGLRIAQISDIHLGPTMDERVLARIVSQANEFNPHLTVVTGDLITKQRDPLDLCVRHLARLRATDGVYGCMGNHEIWAEAEDKLEAMAAGQGIKFLRYEASLLRFGSARLNLVGTDYEENRNRSRYLERAAPLRQPDAVNLLLSHNPDVIGAAAAQGFDITLAGHTHGGQVTLEFLHPSVNIARYYTPYVYGRYNTDVGGKRATAWVTRGVGTIFVPARLGAPPEIPLIRLRRA